MASESMQPEIIAAAVGGIIGIVGALSATWFATLMEHRRQKTSIRTIVAAETVAIQERAQRYIEGRSNPDELAASTPMLTSIAVQFGYLTLQQAIAYRRAVALDMELKKSKSTEKAKETVSVCKETMRLMR